MIRIPGKIPITIHPLFWLIAFFIGWMWTTTLTGAFICLGVILLSVLFHEFGHAVTAIAFGQRARIELAAFGGFTYREGGRLKLWKEFIVVLNGPLAGLVLFAFSFFIYKNVSIANPALLLALKFTFAANLFWTIINLVPVLPLDGGHLLSIVLEGIFGFKGIKMAIIIGLVIAVAISIFFFILGQFLVGALFLLLTFESFRSLRYYKLFNEKDRDEELQTLLKKADSYKLEGRMEEAVPIYEKVRAASQKGILYTMATQEMARIYKEKKEYEKAYNLLTPIQKNLSSQYLPLLHFLAFKNGDLKTTLKIGNQCYQVNPTYETALINACANGLLSNVEASIGWLECCIRDNIPSISEAISRHDFDLIREDARFRTFLSRVT